MGETSLEFLLSFLDPRLADECEVSVYSYLPQTVKDDRITYRIPLVDFKRTIDLLLPKLKSSQEVAISSRFHKEGSIFHLPMIDFYTSNLERARHVGSLLRRFNLSEGHLFSSGNSYHLYGTSFLTQEKWIQFMGCALLLNSPNEEAVVDWRWIGHRLIAGYGTLRLTSSSGTYKKTPEWVEKIVVS